MDGIQKAAFEGDLNKLESILAENPKQVLSKDADGRTPIHWATSAGHVSCVKRLLNNGDTFEIDLDDMTDESGWSPLHIVCSTGNMEIFLLIMKHSPKPDVNAPTLITGQTPLHFAISKKNFLIATSLVVDYNASCRIKDKKGQYPFHRAAAIGSRKACELLIKTGKSPLNAKDVYGFTPLHHAMAEGHVDIALFLVEQGADPEVQDAEGLTPSQVALNKECKEAFDAALGEGL